MVYFKSIQLLPSKNIGASSYKIVPKCILLSYPISFVYLISVNLFFMINPMLTFLIAVICLYLSMTWSRYFSFNSLVDCMENIEQIPAVFGEFLEFNGGWWSNHIWRFNVHLLGPLSSNNSWHTTESSINYTIEGKCRHCKMLCGWQGKRMT